MTPAEKKAAIHAMVEASEEFHADDVRVIGRNADESEILFVAVFATGTSAARIAKQIGSDK